MLKIGITGNIGSGKTTISKMFEVLGIPVFYADAEAKKVMTTDPVLVAAIKKAFGDAAYLPDGSLDRKYIANIVFNNDEELAKLNALTHPAVFRAFDNWVADIKNAPYVMKEAALLFESASYKMCDYSLLVTAPLDLRIQRVTRRDHITPAEVEAREAKQFTEAKKRELADYLIENDEMHLIIPQVLQLHHAFLQLASGG
ncbi:dephospho-CoA kinase [Mucilaginibacter sp. UR6-11]|uniref:dephospho-CoA kinase n=1 Tax=Mucilaginibacter sp. UR6-11 TaxID=1435644 RepID=UPI001E404F44|nr:dephospho-CoA kinase [Mucilaginibacter sp. UR6-11]MCC8425540.1 dephospho-CoA kinase [Mucilaginibacter sp. UR6-11]